MGLQRSVRLQRLRRTLVVRVRRRPRLALGGFLLAIIATSGGGLVLLSGQTPTGPRTEDGTTYAAVWTLS